MFATLKDVLDVLTVGYVLVVVAVMTAGSLELFKIFRERK